MKPLPDTLRTGPLDELRRRYPWPEVRPYANLKDWSLDGGGKELVLDVIAHKGISLMVEVGAFVGGSAKVWLKANPGLTLIAIDPWAGDWWVNYAKQNGKDRLAEVFAGQDGPFKAFTSLVWNFRDRVIAMRGSSPGTIEELHALGIRPQLFFFDSNKSGEELELCSRLFPSAALTGDDRTWSLNGEFPIRKAVTAFAARHGLSYQSLMATWVLWWEPLSAKLQLRWARRSLRHGLITLWHALARVGLRILGR